MSDPRAWIPPAARPRAESARGGFIGREDVMRALGAALEDAVAGRGRLILLSGEPGIGKTRTAEQLAAYARALGSQVVWGRCYEGEGAPAFWPWVEVLRAGVALFAPDELRAAVGSTPELVQLLPGLRERVPDLPEPAMTESAEARFRLFDALATFLGRLAQPAPLVVIVDDLHGADRSSLLLLEFVARAVHQMPLLLLATYRDVDVRTERGLSESLVELARAPGTQQLQLSGLSSEEVGQFLQANTGAAAPGALVALLHERTEGNPLFVREFVRVLVAEGRLPASESAAELSIAVPLGVRAVIERRLAPLSAACRTALRAAAVIGREFLSQVLSAVLILAAPSEAYQGIDVEEVLEEAEASGIVSRSSDTPRRFRFAHALVQDTLYDGLRMSERQQLHRRVGEALEQRPDVDEHLAELAYHFSAAACTGVGDTASSDVLKAVTFARRAAGHAVRLHAYEEGVRLYRFALALLERANIQDDHLRCTLLVDLGVAQHDACDVEASKDTLRDAVRLARRLNLREELSRSALVFGTRIFWGEQVAVDRERIELIDTAIEAWGETPSALHARLLALLAQALRISDQRERRLLSIERALAMSRETNNAPAIAEALETWLLIRWAPANLEQRCLRTGELIELGQRTQRLESTWSGYMWDYRNLVELGDARGAEVALSRCQGLAGSLRHPYYDAVVQTATTMTLVRQGRFAEARRAADDVLSLEQRLGSGIPFAYGQIRFGLACTQGRHKALAATADSVRPFSSPHFLLADIRSALAYLLSELHRPDEARAEFEALAAQEFANFTSDETWFLAMRHVSEVCAYLEDQPRAAVLVELLHPYETRTILSIGSSGYFGPVSHCLGILEACLSRWSDAARHFEYALQSNRNMGALPWLARTQYEYARMLLARGHAADAARARTLLEEARATARELDMPLLEERVSGYWSLVVGSPDRAAASIGPNKPETSDQELGTNMFRREGHYWTVSYAGTVVHLKDGKGVQYLAHLLSHPGREWLALDLIQGAGSGVRESGENQGAGTRDQGPPALDAQAKHEYRARLQELRAELTEAEQFNDLGRAAKLKAEIDFLARQLNAAVDLYGKDRKVGAAAERSRLMVTKRVKSVLKALDTLHPALAHHLRACVKTGYYCAYTPPPGQPVVWQT